MMEFQVLLSGPASSQARFALSVSGPFRAKEIRNVMRQLEIVREWAEADEAEEAAQAAITQDETSALTQ